MAYWLLKSDPETYSFDHLQKDKKTVWDGVANFTALRHIASMQKGDRALVYHSGAEKSIVGIAEIIGPPYPDPRKNDPRVVVVEIMHHSRLKNPVTLAAIKARKEFASFPLVRIPRLSVMPVTDAQWTALLKMSNE